MLYKPAYRHKTEQLYLYIWQGNTWYFYYFNNHSQYCKHQRTETKQTIDIYASDKLIFSTFIMSTISPNIE